MTLEEISHSLTQAAHKHWGKMAIIVGAAAAIVAAGLLWGFSTISDVGLSLTVFGLLLAFLQLHDARGQARTLENVHGSISTRFLSVFPNYVKHLPDMVNRTERSLYILCDIPAYGVFSAGDDFRRYAQAVEHKADPGGEGDKIEVKLICLEEKKRRDMHKAQFGKYASKWGQWREENKQKLDKFCRRYAERGQSHHNISYDEFISCLDQSHLKTLRHEFEYCQVTETEQPVSIYMWIRDEEEALFTARSHTGEGTEVGFVTKDSKLVEALMAIYTGYEKSN